LGSFSWKGNGCIIERPFKRAKIAKWAVKNGLNESLSIIDSYKILSARKAHHSRPTTRSGWDKNGHNFQSSFFWNSIHSSQLNLSLCEDPKFPRCISKPCSDTRLIYLIPFEMVKDLLSLNIYTSQGLTLLLYALLLIVKGSYFMQCSKNVFNKLVWWGHALLCLVICCRFLNSVSFPY